MSYNPISCPAQLRQHRCRTRNRSQGSATIGSIMQSSARPTQLRARTCNTTQRTGRLLSPRARNRSSCDLVPEPRATSSGAKPSPGEPRIASFGDAGRSPSSPRRLRGDHRLHRHPKFHRTTLCVAGPRNQFVDKRDCRAAEREVGGKTVSATSQCSTSTFRVGASLMIPVACAGGRR